jgi:phospholipase/carboxylesterase
MREQVVEIAGLQTTVVGDLSASRTRIVLLHGFAMEPADLAPFAHSLGFPGAFLFPRGPLAASLEPGVERGRAWWHIDPVARAAALARGPRDFAGEHPIGLPEARAGLGRFLDELGAKTGSAGERRLVLGGFSQGAMLVCDMFLRAPRPLAGLALLSGSRIAFDEWPPLLATWGRGSYAAPPVFACHGKADRDLAFDAGRALRDCLVAAGAAVTWVEFDQGHEIPLVAWRYLRKFLLATAPADSDPPG